MTPADEPALDDDTTARLFEVRAQWVRNHTWTWLTLAAGLALSAWMWRGAPVVGLAVGAAMLVGGWQTAARGSQPGHAWIVAARRLLTDEPWRETPATVLATRGTVLALPGGEHVRVYGLDAPARDVVVRAGRVRVVGPDASGWLAVRVDGLHTPWPAKVVSPVRAGPASPSAEPVVAAWGRHVVGAARGDLAFAVLLAVGMLVATVLLGEWVFAAVAAAGGVVVAAVLGLRLRKAVRLCGASNWRRATVVRTSWTTRQYGTADGTVELAFPDGHRYTAELVGVPVDLLATAWREETLWVADGGVVGFPDYPLAAFATFTPVTAPVS
ncbi:hypothetical protein [Actinophytocola sp. NPDC049390]|uniref:hypothetical protein n=1 Tax=Actinophytocola sp. NPDC049390 TaxID=3363894 RepID=UPI0037BC5692